jgi:hypothetical protein
MNIKGGGSADIYCKFCHSPINYYNNAFTITNINKYKKHLLEIYEEIKKIKIKKKRQTLEFKWMLFAIGGTGYNSLPFDDLDDFEYTFFKKLVNNFTKIYKPVLLHKISKYKWLSDITFMHFNNKNIKILYADDNGYLFDKNKNKYDGFIDGICVHTDCFKIFEKKYGNFFYSNINFKKIKNKVLEKSNCNDFKKINIVGIDLNNLVYYPYNSQFFEWLNYFYCKNDSFILESPLKNKKKRDRILNYNVINIKDTTQIIKLSKKIIKPSKKIIKTSKKKRPSPGESATLFKVGTKKKGNDGNIWVIKKNKNGVNRWSKV